jgi:2-oxoglutarate/2-oxoacid ferredoxin oxidoreductase subunit alpha
MSFSLMDGNEATARAAVDAGCRFYAGYPITPASSLNDWMLRLLPPAGGVCIQSEDEIAAMGNCLGAAMAGEKAMIATSGPGISLCSEQISFAVGSEIPLVIVNVQRLGPSTGSPTRGADGDIQFMRWGQSGGMPVMVLSPVDVLDCFELTLHAFNLAETYRCPVFIASNKEVGTTQESIDLATIRAPERMGRRLAAAGAAYQPYSVPPGRLVPDFLPVGGEVLVRQTSSTHGPDGYITTDARLISEYRQRLNRKAAAAVPDALYDYTPAEGAEVLVITYGVSARAARVAVGTLAEKGCPVGLFILKTLFPVPEEPIAKAAAGYRRVLVIEMNLGQYVREIERILPPGRIGFLGRMDGELISPGQIQGGIIDGITSK